MEFFFCSVRWQLQTFVVAWFACVFIFHKTPEKLHSSCLKVVAPEKCLTREVDHFFIPFVGAASEQNGNIHCTSFFWVFFVMNLTGVILGNEVLYNQAAIYGCLRRETVGDVFRVIWCVVQQKPYKALGFVVPQAVLVSTISNQSSRYPLSTRELEE